MEVINMIQEMKIDTCDFQAIVDCIERTLKHRESAKNCAARKVEQKGTVSKFREPLSSRSFRDTRLGDIVQQYKDITTRRLKPITEYLECNLPVVNASPSRTTTKYITDKSIIVTFDVHLKIYLH